jgi:hypothetical protein
MRASTLLCLSLFLHLIPINASAQALPSQLQIGTPIERALAAGQSHSYSLTLEKDQLVQLVVDQRGIDVIVRVFSPAAKPISEVDSPNGTAGPEEVRFIAGTNGNYRIEVAPLGQFETVAPGRYEIKVVEVRKATEQELQTTANQKASRVRGLALLIEAAQSFDQLHRPQTRAEMQIKAAQLLWKSDEKSASKLMTQAMDSVREFIGEADDSEQEYYQSFQVAMQLRRRIVDVLAPHDPEAALNFLRSTRNLTNPYQNQPGQPNQELQLELSLVNGVIATDPKRAFEMAEDTLKQGSPPGLIETVNRLRSKDRELAGKLAHDIAIKLTNQNLLKTPEAAYLTTNFLHVARFSMVAPANAGDSNSNARLVSEDDYRDLFQKVVSEVLSYSPPPANIYAPERDAARNLADTVKQLGPELQAYAPDRAGAIAKKLAEFNNQGDQQNALWQQYQAAINDNSVDNALASLAQAPPQMREQLYQQLANNVAGKGDLARAQQIINDNIPNPLQRRQALRSLNQQAIYAATTKGKFDEVLRLLTNFRPVSERNALLGQILDQFGPGIKRAAALVYLEQAKNLVTTSGQADDLQQLQALLGISRAFAKYDVNRAFEIVDPLVNQFNELTTAATTLNGFGQVFYRDNELITMNGNAVAETANQISTTLATLAVINFDRAKTTAERIRQPDIRLRFFLAIAERTILGKFDDHED